MNLVGHYSRKIVGFITVPKKNSIVIYESLFCPSLQQYSLWEQVRMDHGTEFTLIISVQHLIHSNRVVASPHCPVVRLSSRQNHRTERIWLEVNCRVNYPIKQVLIEMEGDGDIDMDDLTTKFCVSWSTIKVAIPAINRYVAAWNCHCIQGRNRGIPNVLAQQRCCTVDLDPTSIPSVDEAVANDEANQVSPLSRNYFYGCDPLHNYPQLQVLREREFMNNFPDMDVIFENILHNSGHLFKDMIHACIDLTQRFATLVP